MTMPGGRPRRAATLDEATEAAAQMAVDRLVADATIPHRRRPATQLSGHLLAAVAAARIAGAAEHLARAYVAKAREAEGLIWEQVGDTFGTTRQSAHERRIAPED